jgi:uncharacterized protein (DUF427 family)
MPEKTSRSAIKAGITVEPNPNRVIVRLGADIIADSTRALVMRAPGTPPAQYIPRADVDMTRLARTSLVTHCPYKGDAAYWSIRSGERRSTTRCGAMSRRGHEMAEIRSTIPLPDRVTSVKGDAAYWSSGAARV